eukprot:110815-Rhodomonas_salina.1
MMVEMRMCARGVCVKWRVCSCARVGWRVKGECPLARGRSRVEGREEAEQRRRVAEAREVINSNEFIQK